jgi:hypothetical protein
VSRFSHLAPEEIVGAILLVLVLAFAAARPAAITEVFTSPYATPAPGGGPARELVPAAPTPSPAGALPGEPSSRLGSILTVGLPTTVVVGRRAR